MSVSGRQDTSLPSLVRSPSRTSFLASSDCLATLSKTIQNPAHRIATPACLFQQRTTDYIAPVSTALHATVGHKQQPPAPGQIPCPRYDPKYHFRHKDGVSFPLEPFAANSYFAYSGDYVESKRHGSGIVVCKDGSTVAGDFAGGELTGHGTHTWPDGTVYTGSLCEGEAHGFGEQFWVAGSVRYKGEFQMGLMHGKGRWSRYFDREVYEGEFCKHKRCGQGTLIKKNELVYTGGFVDDAFHGQGVIELTAAQPPGAQRPSATSTSKGKYSGMFCRGLFEGQGVLSTSDGIVYSGPFRCGLRAVLPKSLQFVKTFVKDMTVSNYIQGGHSPSPASFPPGMLRLDREMALMQDPYVNIIVGTSLQVVAAHCSMVVEDPLGTKQSAAEMDKLKPPRDGRRGTTVAVPPPLAASRPKLGGGGLAQPQQPPRSRHLADDLSIRAASHILTNETGRRVQYFIVPVPHGEDPFLFALPDWDDVAEVYSESTSSEAIALHIGEVLSSKPAPSSTLKLSNLQVPSSMNSRMNSARAGSTSSSPRLLTAAPPPPPSTVSPGCVLFLEKLLRSGQCSATLRPSAKCLPGEYVLVARVVPDDAVQSTVETYVDLHTTKAIMLQEARLPFRVVPMDFHAQKAYIQAFQTGNAQGVAAEVFERDSSSVEDPNDSEAGSDSDSSGGDDDAAGDAASPGFILHVDDGMEASGNYDMGSSGADDEQD